VTAVELTDQIVAGLDPAVRSAVAGPLAERVAEGLEAVTKRWPDAPAPSAELAKFIAERVARQPDVVAKVGRLRIDDLVLAWWACSGDTDGIVAFEAAFSDQLGRLLHRFHRLNADELRQALRIKLFVGTDTAPPRLRDYSGFGFLQNWLKVTAVRSFLDAARSERGRRVEEELDDEMLGLAAVEGDPRDVHQRTQVGGAIKRAFAAAVAELAPRERTFLRHASVDSLTLDQIAATYQVHRATVARILASARKRLLDATRANVVAELGIAPDEIDSAIRMLDSKLDLSLSRVLRDPAP
jgi:RNA polymerase sigma-70 factor (ECF subfamily)